LLKFDVLFSVSSSPKVIRTDYELVYNFYDSNSYITVTDSPYIEEMTSLEFKLVSAKSFTNPSYVRTNISFCQEDLPLEEEDNVCIYKHNGFIRVAFFNDFHRMTCGNGTFLVSVSSLYFPYRQIQVSLNLKCIDSCAPIGERITKMIRSGCHKGIKTLASSGESNTLSSSGKNISKILGFQVVIFRTDEAVGWMINVEDLKSNNTFIKNVTIGYQLPEATNRFLMPLTTLDLKNFDLEFRFTQILNNKSLGRSYDAKVITMYYISDMHWCMSRSCLTEYMQWKESLVGYKGDGKCRYDHFMDQYYASCFGKIMFYSWPFPRWKFPVWINVPTLVN